MLVELSKLNLIAQREEEAIKRLKASVIIGLEELSNPWFQLKGIGKQNKSIITARLLVCKESTTGNADKARHAYSLLKDKESGCRRDQLPDQIRL